MSKTFPRVGKVQMKNDTSYNVIYFCFSYSSKSNELNDTLEQTNELKFKLKYPIAVQ